MILKITDHAMVRFYERVAGLPVERLRAALAADLARAARAAGQIGASHYAVKRDGVTFVVDNGVVLTVLAPEMKAVSLAAFSRALAETGALR
ncbi:hypothetical protein [Rhodoblastus sp.]|uniref:hypothetical protein n=1 Tax=Rhodoblastus sp. TaxID=1962975 RepID=UPI003F9CB707